MKLLLYPVGSKHYQTIFLVDGKWPRRKFKTIAHNYIQYGTCGIRAILCGLHLNKCEKGQQKCNIVCRRTPIQRISHMHTNANTLFYLSRQKCA